jgi:hypothetical protein
MSKNSNTVKPVQMFCKVCLDAGKSESEYTSHFIRETRDPNSKVVCPTLLALECRFCFGQGHTVKYCTVLIKKEKEKNRSQKLSEYNATTNQTKPKVTNTNLTNPKVSKKPSNAFACLDGDSDGEETQVLKKTIKKVAFNANDSFISKGLRNYAAALAAPAPKILPKAVIVDILISQAFHKEKPKVHDLVNTSFKTESKESKNHVPKQAPWASASNKVVQKNNWAAMEESDDEDDCYSDNYSDNFY